MFSKGICNKKGNCAICDGSKKCHSCGGSGRNPCNQDLDCPTCKGSGQCSFCLPKATEVKNPNRKGWAVF